MYSVLSWMMARSGATQATQTVMTETSSQQLLEPLQPLDGVFLRALIAGDDATYRSEQYQGQLNHVTCETLAFLMRRESTDAFVWVLQARQSRPFDLNMPVQLKHESESLPLLDRAIQAQNVIFTAALLEHDPLVALSTSRSILKNIPEDKWLDFYNRLNQDEALVPAVRCLNLKRRHELNLTSKYAKHYAARLQKAEEELPIDLAVRRDWVDDVTPFDVNEGASVKKGPGF